MYDPSVWMWGGLKQKDLAIRKNRDPNTNCTTVSILHVFGFVFLFVLFCCVLLCFVFLPFFEVYYPVVSEMGSFRVKRNVNTKGSP